LTWPHDGQKVAFYLGGEDVSSRASDLLLRVNALDVASGEIRRLAEIHHAVRAQLAFGTPAHSRRSVLPSKAESVLQTDVSAMGVSRV
jgi:hypothetical protein